MLPSRASDTDIIKVTATRTCRKQRYPLFPEGFRVTAQVLFWASRVKEERAVRWLGQEAEFPGFVPIWPSCAVLVQPMTYSRSLEMILDDWPVSLVPGPGVHGRPLCVPLALGGHRFLFPWAP